MNALLQKGLGPSLRFDLEAYCFVLDALEVTLKKLKVHRHVTADELLDGLRRYAIKLYGPMAKTVLESWKVRRCEDFGEIVFDLVTVGLITKRDADSKSDFNSGYDFIEAFEKPFKI